MAVFITPTPDEQKQFEEWLAGRPAAVKEMVRSHPPDRLYKLDNHRVIIRAYREDGTVIVTVSGEFNRIAFERDVFGISLDDLVECDLPGPDEPIGTALTDQDEIDAYINFIRPSVLARRSLDEEP